MSMNKNKLVILSRSFATASQEPLRYLEKSGIDYKLVRNKAPEDVQLIADEIGEAEAVIVGSDVIGKFVMDRCPNLKIVSKHGVGLDSIDLDLAKERGIAVTRTPDANNESVADLSVLLMLAILRNFSENVISSPSPDWSSKPLSNDLYEKTVGLIGFGKIGMSVANRLAGFDCELLISDPIIKQEDIKINNAKLVDFEYLLKNSDIVSIHAPLMESTHHLINAAAIAMMKDGAILINTSRGALTDEKAVYDALVAGKLKGAGLDVFSSEPPVNEPLLTLKNVVATPHIAPHTVEANYRMGMAAAKNVVEYFQNH